MPTMNNNHFHWASLGRIHVYCILFICLITHKGTCTNTVTLGLLSMH